MLILAWIAQLVAHRLGTTEVVGSNPSKLIGLEFLFRTLWCFRLKNSLPALLLMPSCKHSLNLIAALTSTGLQACNCTGVQTGGNKKQGREDILSDKEPQYNRQKLPVNECGNISLLLFHCVTMLLGIFFKSKYQIYFTLILI